MKKIAAVIIVFVSTVANAQLRMPSIISDNMVLQQGKEINIWGWAAPGAPVEITFLRKAYKTQTGTNGQWQIKLSPARGGASGAMFIKSANEKIVISHILVGEVWVCSGQSNMEFTLSGFRDQYEKELRTDRDDNIRYITVKNTVDNKENADAGLKNEWAMIDSSTIGNCSAAGYFFAKKLREKLKVPVGLIISSWGGTPAQAWMDTNSLKGFPDYSRLYDTAIKTLDFTAIEELRKKNEEIYQQKISAAAVSFKTLTTNNYNDAAWEKAAVPKNWEGAGHPDLDGIAVYRIRFTLAPGEPGQAMVLHLPAIDDIDSTYINGVFIGSQRVWNELRTYLVPPGILQVGENVITIWVEDGQGGGGLNEDPGNFYVQMPSRKIELKGEARFKILVPKEQIAKGVNFSAMQNQPAVLFNAMIAPLLNCTVRGVIWYQGESNASNYTEYRTLFPALINCWRQRWQQKELPFLFVQLSSYNPAIKEPEESDWAGLREAQALALQLPATGMAVTIDVGDQTDIHPKRKKEVGDRLAANAFHLVYGFKSDVPAGPLYASYITEGNKIVLSFSNTGKGLMQKGDKIEGFVIAGADKKFVPAEAVLRGNTVVVSSTAIPSPVYVRYAWANAPMNANLYNKEGFPAAPFRTDK